tara:strand:- start:7065 stop:8525 length:1461 start_codon:yes stop_codon:yes gene_type:complete
MGKGCGVANAGRRQVLGFGGAMVTAGFVDLHPLTSPAEASGLAVQVANVQDTAALAHVGGCAGTVVQTSVFNWHHATALGGARYLLVPQEVRTIDQRWVFASATRDWVWQLVEAQPDPAMFGAQGDGETDDTAALQAGLNYLSHVFGGGELVLSPRRYRSGSLSLPRATGIVGSRGGFASHYPETLSASVYTLVLDVGATVTMHEACTMQGVVLRPHGMTFPQGIDQIAHWEGTAITIAPESSGVNIGRCMIVGFAQAILAAGLGPIYRCRIEDVNLDCLNGISLSDVPDVAYLSRIHAWNFASTGRRDANAVERPGVAFRLAKRADWVKLTDCFCYGYEIGFELEDVADCLLTGCGADHKQRPSAEASSTGFKLHGRARNNRLIGCQAAAQGRGIHLTTNAAEPRLTNHIQGGEVWDNGVALEISAGHAMVSDLAVRVRGGVVIGVAAAGGRLSGLSFDGIAEPRVSGDEAAIGRFVSDKPVVVS